MKPALPCCPRCSKRRLEIRPLPADLRQTAEQGDAVHCRACGAWWSPPSAFRYVGIFRALEEAINADECRPDPRAVTAARFWLRRLALDAPAPLALDHAAQPPAGEEPKTAATDDRKETRQ